MAPAPGVADLRRVGHRRGRALNTHDLGEQAFPYVFLDATYCKARVGGDKHGKGTWVVSQAVVIATGVSADGVGRCCGARGRL